MSAEETEVQNNLVPERLPFRLHDFTRWTWVSDRARDVWEPRIQRITHMLFQVERMSVAHGTRRCLLRSITEQELASTRDELSTCGMGVEPLQGIRMASSYSSSLEPCTDDPPSAYWCVIGSEPYLSHMQQAYEANDQPRIGELLGYPVCCNEFFQRTWVDNSLVDTTWPMAMRSPSATKNGKHSVVIESTSVVGMQLRWLGVRTVFHLPCSFECEASLRLAELHMSLAESAGFGDEVSWLTDMLKWPVEWTALHGIAEIRAPVVRIVTRTDATPSKYSVRYQGEPAETAEGAASGLVFPFIQGGALPVTSSRSFQLGLESKIESSEADALEHAPWYCTDNGFSTRYAMDRAHTPIIALAEDLRVSREATEHGLVVFDIGCGNGALARKLAQLSGPFEPGGIDFDPAKIAHANILNPDWPARHFVQGDMFESRFLDRFTSVYLVVLMIGRLIEVPQDRADNLLAGLRTKAENMIVYAYDDYINDHGSVDDMAKTVGLSLVEDAGTANVRLANLQ